MIQSFKEWLNEQDLNESKITNDTKILTALQQEYPDKDFSDVDSKITFRKLTSRCFTRATPNCAILYLGSKENALLVCELLAKINKENVDFYKYLLSNKIPVKSKVISLKSTISDCINHFLTKDFLKTFTTDQLKLKLGQIYMDSKDGKKIYEIVGLNELNYGTISVVKSFLQIATGKDEKSFN